MPPLELAAARFARMFSFEPNMSLVSATPSFAFMRYRRESLIASGVLSVVSVVWLIFRGLNLGLDFTGGVPSWGTP